MHINCSDFLKFLSFFCAFFYTFSVFSQIDTLYYDEEEIPISKKTFYIKQNSSIYDGVRFTSDTVIVQLLKWNYRYGKLENNHRKNFFKLISERYNIDTTKTLVIHYTHLLKNKSEYLTYSKVYKYDSLTHKYVWLKNHPRFDLDDDLTVSRHMYANTFSSIINGYKRCIKFHDKFSKNIKVIHFYGENRGFPIDKKKLEWYPNNNYFLSKIFNSLNSFIEIIILQPNGEFYVQYGNPQYDYEYLINPKYWDNNRHRFLNEMNNILNITK